MCFVLERQVRAIRHHPEVINAVSSRVDSGVAACVGSSSTVRRVRVRHPRATWSSPRTLWGSPSNSTRWPSCTTRSGRRLRTDRESFDRGRCFGAADCRSALRAHEVVDHVLGVDDFRGYLLLEEDEDVCTTEDVRHDDVMMEARYRLICFTWMDHLARLVSSSGVRGQARYVYAAFTISRLLGNIAAGGSRIVRCVAEERMARQA